MSKIRNLFQKVFQKNKNSEDLEEFDVEFDEDIEEYDLAQESLDPDEEFNEDLSDQTVILNQEEIGEELIPHKKITDADSIKVPADTELQFPDLPPEHKNKKVTTNTQDDEFSDLTLNDEEESQDLMMMKEHHEETPIISEGSSEEDIITEEAEIEEEEKEEVIETTEEESDYFPEDEEYDLSDTNLSLKEKIEQLKTRALDRFRSFNNKDLNLALKENKGAGKLDFNSSLKDKILNINWVEIPQKFFNKNLQNDYHKYFKITGTILTVITLASIIGTFFNLSKNYGNLTKRNLITLGDPNTLSKDDLNHLKAAQVFKTEKVVAKKGSEKIKVDKNIVCTTATRKSNANVKLINTVVLQDSVKSIASVQVRSSSKLQNIREGENLLGQVKIDKIERLRLIVKNLKTGVCESIESSKLQKSKPRGKSVSVLSPGASKSYKKQLKKIDGIENDGNNFNIKKDFLKDKLSDISSILTQARGIQINNPDGTISFKVVDIEPGGVFAYLGVQDNDIITHINGEPITELNQVMSLFGKIGNIPNLKLTMKRAGEPITQNYNIK